MTNYSQQYFGKELSGLTYDDIIDFFIEEKEESDKIEFKAFHPTRGNFNKNLEGVIRGICGFLNSNGGILIWGAPLKQKIDEREIFQGELSPVKEFKEKDSLISKISDSITPLPININVNIIEQDGNYLYLFETQISNYSPHQYNNTYFVRLDGQTKPAPHYLVEALFKKITFPNIEGYINLDKFGHLESGYAFLDITIFMINFSQLQNESNFSYKLMCAQGVFEDSSNPEFQNYYQMDGHLYVNKNSNEILHFGAVERNNKRLIFKMGEIRDKYNYKMDLMLTFGGEKSPLKISDYRLDLSGTISMNNPKLFEKINENVSFIDKQKQLGTTRENLLEHILKR